MRFFTLILQNKLKKLIQGMTKLFCCVGYNYVNKNSKDVENDALDRTRASHKGERAGYNCKKGGNNRRLRGFGGGDFARSGARQPRAVRSIVRGGCPRQIRFAVAAGRGVRLCADDPNRQLPLYRGGSGCGRGKVAARRI